MVEVKETKKEERAQINNEKMMELERTVGQWFWFFDYARKAMILMLRKSQGLTKPICLKLDARSEECRGIAHGFVGFGFKPSFITINDLISEAGSTIFFNVRGGKEIIIFLGDFNEALENPLGFNDVMQVKIKNKYQ